METPLTMKATQDIHVRRVEELIHPNALKAELPMTEAANATVVAGREGVDRILSGEDDRMLFVVGPCSIHNEALALEYAGRLKKLAGEVADRLLVVMRVYFEKPRTTVGWKGLINDPNLDDSFRIADGLRLARRILIEINERGLPAASEMLDPITPQYTADLVAWGSIGARTTESQTHRQMASGLSMSIGYKNGTDGNLDVAINAMRAAREGHAFLGIDGEGRTCVVHTTGNELGHLILRGGHGGSNYDPASVQQAHRRLAAVGLNPRLLIDCSHANSDKDFRRQGVVLREVLAQRVAGDEHLIGVMIESNLEEGNQALTEDLGQLRWGVSITDPCIGWDETERLLREAHTSLAKV
jgi:3-deoxy-7-phosphoheptulonate synthase